MSRSEQIAAHRGFPWLEVDEPQGVAEFLAERRWLDEGERFVRCEKAGEGNMNLTLRIVTDRRTMILKQARPRVEKYPQIPAPWDRAVFEQRFYARVGSIPEVAARMPRLLAVDADARALLLEDLADSEDLSSLYRGGSIDPGELNDLAAYLHALHATTRGTQLAQFANREMRALNHAHIFKIPLEDQPREHLNTFEPHLALAAEDLAADKEYLVEVEATGQRYLDDGPCLVHGDYFPGSWLRTPGGIRVIDPEFSFCGDAEVDLGCAVAHFALARQPVEVAANFLRAYEYEADDAQPADAEWIARYAAAEVMRRLIGVAQLPIPETDGFRAALLARSRRAMLEQSWEVLWD